MPEMILLIGIPASGKSTFTQRRFAQTHVVISLDILKTRAREAALLEQTLADGKDCIIDNTNVNVAERARFIEKARLFGYRIVGYYFQSNISDCLVRNRQRTGRARIPDAGVFGRAKLLQRPQLDEGFDQLFHVVIADGDFNVSPWLEGRKVLESQQQVIPQNPQDTSD